MALNKSMALVAVLLSGCSTLPRTDHALYWGLASADTGTTYVGLSDGLHEANPLVRIGRTPAGTAAVSLLVSYAVYRLLLHELDGPRGHNHEAWVGVNILRAIVVGWNLHEVTRQ